MSSAILLFAARVAVLVLRYAFLYMVVRSLRRDLRAAAHTNGSVPPGPAGRSGAGNGRGVAAAMGLQVIDAGQTDLSLGACFPLRDPFLIGRAPINDIALDDDWISSQHVRLRQANGAWLAEDLGSTNGTRINGRAVVRAAPLRPGDVLDLGRVRFKVVEPA
jgi:hypothetical protein